MTTTDHTCTKCPINAKGQSVYASDTRGTYVGLNVQAIGRYKAAYGSDDYQMNRYVNFNLGVRWEEEEIGGSLLKYTFTMAAGRPRLGINIDPMGDHMGKIFMNYGRNYWSMPLDAAIRQLGNEQDDDSYYFAPVINADGSYTIVPDAAHALNGTPKSTTAGVVSNFGAPSFASSTGEGIIPGTKASYEDEYVLGIEREWSKAALWSRRAGPIAVCAGSLKTSVRSRQKARSLPADITAVLLIRVQAPTSVSTNRRSRIRRHSWTAAGNSGATTAATYKAPVAGCTFANDTLSAVGGPFIDGRNNPVGGACFTNLSTSWITRAVQCLPQAARVPVVSATGKSDGFITPVRRYQAMELELDKRFSNHWLAQVNYRWGTLYGNYEGAYRNDNNQSDPGISSLFDVTAGALGLLNSQFANGDLSTDRRNVGNMFLSYNVGSDTPFFHMLKGLTVGFRPSRSVGRPSQHSGRPPRLPESR